MSFRRVRSAYPGQTRYLEWARPPATRAHPRWPGRQPAVRVCHVPCLAPPSSGLLSGFFAAVLAGPGPGQGVRAVRGGTVHRSLDRGEDRALQRRGDEDLAPAAGGIGGLRRLVLPGGELPRLLEDRPGQQATEHAGQQAREPEYELVHRSNPSSTAAAFRAAFRSRLRLPG